LRLIALGRTNDVRGFALAGVETVTCQTVRQADAALRTLGSDPTVGVVMIPTWVERAIPAAIARVRVRRRAPVLLVLPLGDSDSME
jgi:vacuolar-type H+-ATPase subunit F/Vma7